MPPRHVEDHTGIGRRDVHQAVERTRRRVDFPCDLPGRHGRCGTLLLEDDVVPAARGDGIEQFLVFQVAGKALAALEEARTGEFHLLRRGDLPDGGRHVVVIGIAVADPQHPQRIGVTRLREKGHEQQQQEFQDDLGHRSEVWIGLICFFVFRVFPAAGSCPAREAGRTGGGLSIGRGRRSGNEPSRQSLPGQTPQNVGEKPEPAGDGRNRRERQRPGRQEPAGAPEAGTYPFVRWSAAYLRHQAAIPHSPHLGLRAMQT